MSATVQGKLSPNFSFSQTQTSGFLNGQSYPIPETLLASFANGTLADQCNKISVSKLTFVASTPQTLDLTAMTDIFGTAINFARVRGIVVKVYSTTDGVTLTLGNAGTNEWDGFLSSGGTLKVGPSTLGNPDGGFFILITPSTTGWAVDSTHKNLKLDPGSAAFVADVILVGSDV